MKIADYILEYLSKNGSVQIPEFGEFLLEDVGAQFDADSNRFLPPAKLIHFRADYLLEHSKFSSFLAEKQQISAETARAEIKKQTDFWKQKLGAGEELEVNGIGTFYPGETLKFSGNRVESSTPDYYGLEEIALNDVKKSGNTAVTAEKNDTEEGAYKMNRGILWVFLIIIPVAALIFLAVTQQERIFGKKSFDDLSVKTSTHRIVTDTIKTDTLQQKVGDSLKADSIQKAQAVPVAVKNKSKSPRKKT